MLETARVGALAAWRPTQGIYRFDPDIFDALWETPVTGDLPAAVLFRLPEWCVYLETPGREVMGMELDGAWLHLESDANTGHDELRLLLLGSDGRCVPVPVHLGATLEEGLVRAVEQASQYAALTGQPLRRRQRQELRDQLPRVAPLISLALYLCTPDPDIEDAKRRLSRPQKPKARGRARKTGKLPAAPEPVFWETGYRLGQRVREARGAEDGAGGAVVRPHVRRAHWHTYRVGAGRKERELRWLAPILVGLDGAPAKATVRKVR